ncbi:hypothetical protein AAG570_013015 [Ranatra chinensis]|uniref:FERM domain-containing protein n=1 Tax=Ranatra chinensis TaxID=642074 RepID=A0ABD0YU50_9HEMI
MAEKSTSRTVTVHLLTADHNLKLAVERTSTFEDILVDVCESLGIGCAARHLFALRYNRTFWAAASSKPWDYKWSEFEFRVRYRVPNPSRLWKVDPKAFDYYFSQVREDMKNGRLTDVKYDEYKKQIIGLVVTDMYREMLEKGVSEDIVLSNYTKYVPKEILRQHIFFLKKPIQKKLMEMKKNLRFNSVNVKEAYIGEMEVIAPNYMTEEYEAEVEEADETKIAMIRVNPFHKEIPGVQYQYVGKSEWNHICTIEDLCYVSLRSDGSIELSRKNGIPVYLKLNSINSMISLVSLLDGYYRLSVKWTFNICKDLTTPSLERLHSLKCHGPVGGEFSYNKLEIKRECKPGCFILRESETSYNAYYIDICTKER